MHCLFRESSVLYIIERLLCRKRVGHFVNKLVILVQCALCFTNLRTLCVSLSRGNNTHIEPSENQHKIDKNVYIRVQWWVMRHQKTTLQPPLQAMPLYANFPHGKNQSGFSHVAKCQMLPNLPAATACILRHTTILKSAASHVNT